MANAIAKCCNNGNCEVPAHSCIATIKSQSGAQSYENYYSSMAGCSWAQTQNSECWCDDVCYASDSDSCCDTNGGVSLTSQNNRPILSCIVGGGGCFNWRHHLLLRLCLYGLPPLQILPMGDAQTQNMQYNIVGILQHGNGSPPQPPTGDRWIQRPSNAATSLLGWNRKRSP